MIDERANITGVVLAGGRGRRMRGQDKGLLELGGRPLVSYALDALTQAAGTILINANRNLKVYEGFGYRVVADRSDAFCGPLAGLLSAMLEAQTRYVLTVPCDSPNLNGDLLRRLYNGLVGQDAEICAAHDGARLHPVFLIAERRLAADLASYLGSGQRKVETWLKSRRLALADFSDHPEMFVNVNTEEDLAAVEAMSAG